ncbi:MAG: CRISPR-associated endoribonuclease Cas6 [Epsilonproteobacteria bacterium]|nr:CRISPR-associated endoribonuclease Cas6 [Campylobacterota bacterium]
MRIEIEMEGKGEFITLPLGYNEAIQGLIYNLLPPPLGGKLHNEGYTYGSRRFKLFTFSRIISERYRVREKSIEFKGPIKIKMAFAVDEVGREIALSLLKHRSVKLDKNLLHLRNLTIQERRPIREENFAIRTLSPISVFTTPEKKKLYLTPEDPLFSKLLKENMEKKYALLSGKEEDFDFAIEPRGEYRELIVRYKRGVIKGVHGTFSVRCDPRIFSQIYDAGLGANNSLGFGMVEMVGE